MNRFTQGVLSLLVLGLFVIVVGYFAWPYVVSEHQRSTSDVSQAEGTITAGDDNFAGYRPFCGSYMRRLMLADRIKFDCIEDKGDNLADRFARLRDGKLDFAVATVDSYLLNGRSANYPGVIKFVIDESKGVDAIVANEAFVKNLTDLQTNLDIKVAYTPDTPSDHLRKVTGIAFDIPLFKIKGRDVRLVPTSGSEEALAKLLSGEVQVAILWEPEVSKALSRPGYIKLIDSSQTDKLIVDILLVSRDFQQKHPERVELVLSNYVKTLKYYHDHPEELRKEMAKHYNVSEDVAQKMIDGLKWPNLYENAIGWFGISQSGTVPQYGLLEAIERTILALRKFGDITGSLFPNDDSRYIISSEQVGKLFAEQMGPNIAPNNFLRQQVKTPLEADFPPLNDEGWAALREVGTLKTIQFQSGSDTLSPDEKEGIDKVVEDLKSYPNFRIIVQGYTRPVGDDDTANQKLSQDRAEAVARYLNVTYGIDLHRIRTIGFGSSKKLTQGKDEKYQAYLARNSRVEIKLMQEAY